MTSKRLALHRVNAVLTTTLTFMIDEADENSSKALQAAHKLSLDGWDINIVDSKRGRCYRRAKVISVPTWAWERSPDYFNYYLSHELTHALVADENVVHGPKFQAKFKSICDPKNWKYELGYKPARAAKAGIMDIPDDF